MIWRKRYLVSLCLGILLGLTGCAATQVRDRTYLQGLELEEDGGVTVSLHDFTAPGAIASATSDSVEQALWKAGAVTGRELFLGHTELIAYADPSFSAALVDWERQYRLSPSCQILVLAAGETLEEDDTSQLTDQLKYAQNTGLLPETELFTILKELSGDGGIALAPYYADGGLSAALITQDRFCASLSKEAVQGLCWLRGDGYPDTVFDEQGESFAIETASTALTARTLESDAIEVTAELRISGEGDFTTAANTLFAQCSAAIAETVLAHGADVFGLEACLKSQCYNAVSAKDWEETLENTTFVVRIVGG